eukprot:TRINITY_DN1019_c0_g2_i1.p1 TRINITY_DN1019_c0_g2~~TRINITY_DN1019_c0_g2_i1.p1  ORF type:complete len:400 (-),score=62.73 TRINITY_DN1019_c0_g2_i1:188-1387(-)
MASSVPTGFANSEAAAPSITRTMEASSAPLSAAVIAEGARSDDDVPSSASSNDLTSSRGSRPSTRGHARRKRIGDLLASCAADIASVERGVADEAALCVRNARVLQARLSTRCRGESGGLGDVDGDIVAAGRPDTHSDGEVLATAESDVNANTDSSRQHFLATGSDCTEAARAETSGGNGCGNGTCSEAVGTSDGIADINRRPTGGAVASGLLEALAQDNTVMECNLRDYDSALRVAMHEVLRLKSDVAQMETACSELGRLENLYSREMQVQARLQQENLQLLERQRQIMSIINEALNVKDDDAETSALVNDLMAENNSLRNLLRETEPAAVLSKAAAAAAVSKSAGPTVAGALSVTSSSMKASGTEGEDWRLARSACTLQREPLGASVSVLGGATPSC